MARGFWFPDQGWDPGPLHWKHGVLATGPPGESLNLDFKSIIEVRLTYSKPYICKDTVTEL